MQMSVSEICCKKFFVFKSRLRRKRLKKNAFKYRYNSALIRFLIFPPVGKKLLVVGKLEIVFEFVRIDIEEIA
ncbi:hypothetical protein EIP51_08705 [Campylobacter coli]|nr:hypothetical protein [Campylobacter coli]